MTTRRIAPVVLLAALGFAAWRLAIVAAGVPLWYDELLTVRISEVGSAAELWRAITAGFDFNPPLIYVATKAARALPIDDPLGARLPALAGFVLFAAAVYRLLVRRVGPWLAVAAVCLIPLADYTVRYAVEARPYMLLLGVSGWALVCWQRLRDRPSAAVTGAFWALLVTALLLHVWAVLLVMAIGIGELIEARRTRGVRWPIVVAMAAALPMLVLHGLLMRASKTLVFENVAYLPSVEKLSAALSAAVPRPRVLLATLLIAAIAGWLARLRGMDNRTSLTPPVSGLALDERAVLAACVASPLVPYAYASIARSAFMPRYALYALLGIVGLTADVLFRLGRRRAETGIAAAVTAFAGMLLYLPPKTVPLAGAQAAVADALEHSRGLPAGVPIVLVNPIDVLTFEEHADAAWLARSVYVADAALARRYTGTDAIDLGYLRGEPYLRLRSTRLEYADLAARDHLLLVGKWQALTWLPQKLRDDGWRLTEIGGTRQAPIYDARRP